MALHDIVFNHNAGVVLPYHLDQEGTLKFLFEQKDPKFKPPYLDNALCFLGGNWQKGIHPDTSPEETARRRVLEEFWINNGDNEEINFPYSSETLARVQDIGRMVMQGLEYGMDFGVTHVPPLEKEDFSCTYTVFLRQLSDDKYAAIERVLLECEGKVTTDNGRHDSRIVLVTLDEAADPAQRKFSWGYDHVLNALLQAGKLSVDQPLVRNPKVYSHVEPLFNRGQQEVLERMSSETRTYKAYQNFGVQYKDWSQQQK